MQEDEAEGKDEGEAEGKRRDGVPEPDCSADLYFLSHSHPLTHSAVSLPKLSQLYCTTAYY